MNWIGVRRIRHGDLLPRLHGLYRYEMVSNEVLTAPVPLNVLYRWGWSAWMALRHRATPTWWEQQLIAAYCRGRNESEDAAHEVGYQHGKRIGYQEGRDAAYAGLLALVDADEAKRRRAWDGSGDPPVVPADGTR